MTDLRSDALSSTKWTIFSSILNSLIALAAGAVLARLLTPHIFGLIAIASLVIALASYFVRMGVGQALIQKENLTSEEVSFAVTFSLVIGFLAAVLITLFSTLIALLFKKPESAPVVAAMSLSLWFASFSATLIGLLRRNMKFKLLSIVSIAQAVFTGGFSIIMAKLGGGVWSLIWPLIISQFLVNIAYLIKLRKIYEIRFKYSPSGQGPLLRFGSKYTLISILEYFGSNLDSIFVGRLFNASQLGLYNKAYKLAYLPTETIVTSINSVMFPVVSRVQNQPEKIRETQNRLFLLVGLVSVCISMGMMPAAKHVVLVLYGDQWLASVPILMIVLVAVPFDFLSAVMGLTFDASGRLNEKIKIQIAALLVLILGFILLAHYGLTGVALALVISHAVRFMIYLLVNQKIYSIPKRLILRNGALIFLAGAITILISQVVVHQTNLLALPVFFCLCLEIMACALVFALFLFFCAPIFLGVKNYSESWQQIKSFVSSKKSQKNE